jgi:hypothetical protein
MAIGPKPIREPLDERVFRADQDEIGSQLARESAKSLEIGRRNGVTFGPGRRPRPPRGSVNFASLNRKTPGKSGFAPARPDDEDSHASEFIA